MKRLLFIISFLTIYMCSNAQMINGPTEGIIGSPVGYHVVFTQVGRITWKTQGGISITSSYNDWMDGTVTGPPGVAIVEAILYDYYTQMPKENAFCYVQIKQDPSAPTITGSTVIIPGSTYTYNCRPDNIGIIRWRIPAEYFDIISDYGESITIKAKELDLEEDISSHISLSFEVPGLKTVTSYKTILIKKLSIDIEKPNIQSLCINDTISYIAKAYTEGAIINWESSNLTLLSGQGTDKALFRATGNGVAKVKVTARYNDKEYIDENSDVWVGAPPRGEIAINGSDYVQQSAGQLYRISRNPWNPQPDHFSVNHYLWMLSNNDAKFLDVNTGQTVTVVTNKTFINDKDLSMVELSLHSVNRCGRTLLDSRYIQLRPRDFREDPNGPAIIGGGPGGDPWAIPDPLSASAKLKGLGLEVIKTYDIKIYQFPSGRIVHEEQSVGEFNIENTTLRGGIYIVEKTDSQGNVTKTKVKKK